MSLTTPAGALASERAGAQASGLVRAPSSANTPFVLPARPAIG